MKYPNIENLKPCPICGKKDMMCMWVSDNIEYPHITCKRCEYDTWTKPTVELIEDWWNNVFCKEMEEK